MTRAQADFSALADGLCRVLEPGEHLMLSYSGEESDFVRLNHARIRQAGRVAQQSVVLDLIADGRHASAQRLLGGDPALDLLQLSEVLVQLRRERSGLDPDPHLLLCEASQGSVRQDEDRLPDSAAAVQTLIACAQGLDLVGLWCAGGIQRGFASSFGQRSWHSVHTFHASWSCHLQGDRATAGRYAGTTFEPAELTRRLAATRAACTALARQPAAILPGRYRAFLAPAAVQELVGMLCWGGFSLKAHRTGTTPLLRLGSLEARLHQAVTMSEDRSQGLAPSFTATGFPLPERVPLVDGGRLAGLLVGPRSAREFALPLNAGEESPESLVMAGGELDQAEILEHLGTGLWISNLWYCNFSDANACRITGMTRFDCWWVEGGVIQAPLPVMRFDDSIYELFGERLLGITSQREHLLSTSTYGGRTLDGMLLPGVLVDGLTLTM